MQMAMMGILKAKFQSRDGTHRGIEMGDAALIRNTVIRRERDPPVSIPGKARSILATGARQWNRWRCADPVAGVAGN